MRLIVLQWDDPTQSLNSSHHARNRFGVDVKRFRKRKIETWICVADAVKMEHYFAALITIESRLCRFCLITSPNKYVVTFQASTTSIAGKDNRRAFVFSGRVYVEENTRSTNGGVPWWFSLTFYEPYGTDLFFRHRPDCYGLDACEKTHSREKVFVKSHASFDLYREEHQYGRLFESRCPQFTHSTTFSRVLIIHFKYSPNSRKNETSISFI